MLNGFIKNAYALKGGSLPKIPAAKKLAIPTTDIISQNVAGIFPMTQKNNHIMAQILLFVLVDKIFLSKFKLP